MPINGSSTKSGISSTRRRPTPDRARWGEDGATLLAAARFAEGQINITFENGETFVIHPMDLLDDPTAQWSDLRLVEDMALKVPTARGSIELPGDHIRERIDPSFARYSAWVYRYTPDGIGRKLRALRQERGLTMAEIGRRTGIGRQNLWKAENGLREPTASTLACILGAMNATWNDLTISDDEYAANVRAERAASHLAVFSQEEVAEAADLIAAEPVAGNQLSEWTLPIAEATAPDSPAPGA